MKLKERLENEILIMDGACGTFLQTFYGLKGGEKPESWCLSHPELIEQMHKMYVDAGSDIILSNSFGANRLKFGDLAPEIVEKAVALAKKVAYSSKKKIYVGLDIGPTGKLIYPFGDLSFEQAYETFKEMVLAGKMADLIVIETMTDLYELKAAILACKENSDLPIIASVTLDSSGKTLTGADLNTLACFIEGMGVDVLGLNCGFGPQKMLEWIPEIIGKVSIPIMIKPNAGMPYIINGKLKYDTDEDTFSHYIEKAIDMGVTLVGGCCGTTPSYIEVISKLKNRKTNNRVYSKYKPMVCSYAKTVFLGEKPIMIGERLNPTGKPPLKEALRSKNFDYLKAEAIRQVESGADILDVNVGLPDISEKEMLRESIINIQAITDVPLQIDTADLQAMEKALRVYNGIPLINSVNGKKESMEKVFPLMKMYGGICVALMLDEKGIPETADGRLEIAKSIIKEAAKYGISKERFLFDPLVMTISTGQENAAIVLDVLRECKNNLELNTVLGVSNISFGLPNRALINAVFFAQALASGLSAGIVDSTNKAMAEVFNAHCALSGDDFKFEKYISLFSSSEVKDLESVLTLEKAIEKGLKKESGILTRKLITLGKEPLDIVNNLLIPTLDKIGKNFEKGIIFLPQLLQSADSAKEAFFAIKEELTRANVVSESKGTIVLATVEGDIHDIGKNIVKVILENYGYTVIDLGKDVKKEEILQASINNNVGLIGLSALMTTTVTNMENTIRYLKTKISTPIMVGGAVLTEKYAEKIGANYYAKDAMSSARIADMVFGPLN